METIEWAEEDSVGVKEIDDQHKELVSITNKLFQAIMDDRGTQVLHGVLSELEKYVIYHFDYEEKLLAEHGFPSDELEKHVLEHETLTKQVRDFCVQVEEMGDTLDMDVFIFLRDWTTDHLQNTDLGYKDFFKEKGLINA